MMAMDARCRALIKLGRLLQLRRYRFVAVSPSTHNRVLRREAPSPTLESVFGWSRPFDLEAIDGDLLKLLEQADALEAEAGQYKSKVRFASIDDLLFVHSAFPTTEPDSVFFGPDTYRFARLLRVTLSKVKKHRPLRLVDIGAGSGAGGIVAVQVLGEGTELILADINRKALALSAVNAALNGLPSAQTLLSDILAEIDGTADVIISNPPYLVDEDRRFYRHGGGELGITLALRIVEESMAKLVPGGCLVLYSGAPIVNGADTFLECLQPVLQLYASHYVYEEIDPDVFGEELDRRAYAHVDRIAAVGLTAIKRG
jgi:methylase of polypeptide subunit release factors